MESFIQAFVFVMGAIIGSFLNVCIVRMPHEKSIVRPASHCPQCKKPINWYDNVPILSYLLLGGKCRSCKAKISFRYVLVEILTGITFVLFYRYFGLSDLLWPYLFMVSCFIVATFVDFEHRIIPDEVSVGGMYAGLAFSLVFPVLHGFNPSETPWYLPHLKSLAMSVVGLFAGGGIIYAMAVFGDLLLRGVVDKSFLEEITPHPDALFDDLVKNGYLRKKGYITSKFTKLKSHSEMIVGPVFEKDKEKIFLLVKDSMGTMGGGDVKLMAMIGAFLGWKLAILTFFVAPFFGAIFGIIEKFRTKGSTMPYGPFLVLAALISLFYGERLIAWILSGYGLF